MNAISLHYCVVVALVTLASGTVLYRAKRRLCSYNPEKRFGIWKPATPIRSTFADPRVHRDNRGIRRFPMSALPASFRIRSTSSNESTVAFAPLSFVISRSRTTRTRARRVCIGSGRAARALLGDARPTLSRAIRLERAATCSCLFDSLCGHAWVKHRSL